MLRVGICDDDTAMLEILDAEVKRWAKEKQEICSVALFTTAEAFLFAWDEKKDMDVLLLDIEMPGTDGMELARNLRQKGEHIGIIFVTGNPDYALEGYDLEAVSYVVKPVKKERLYSALDRAREKAGCREVLLLTVAAGEVERVYVSEICYLESNGHETILRKRGGTNLSCKISLQQMEQMLEGKKEVFFKPHRSYLIHMSCVERITKKDVRMEGGELIPVARGKWEALNRAYMECFRKNDSWEQ
ncbi:MAG: response regulator transcription factor [Lachnospiraceae bacterium]|nr:response regulator transcription factor [Lachnospiraceae bacterium]